MELDCGKVIVLLSDGMGSGEQASKESNEVIDRMGQMLDVADSYGVKLGHENEKGIYGDTPE